MALVSGQIGGVARNALNLPRILLVAGAGCMAIAIFTDFLTRSHARHLGAQQALLLATGCIAVIGAGILRMPAGQRSVRHWINANEATRTANVVRYLAIIAQLALLAFLFEEVRLENAAVYSTILPLTIWGFAVHYWLPLQYRLPFFACLSLFGILSIFGITNGVWLITIGLALLAIAHLPFAFGVRVALLCAVGTGLALARGGLITTPWATVIWPILGSMFMFRLVVYMYDLRHTKEPFDLWRAVSYFFLLPNVVFPLFPVVDYATFRRTYYDQDRYVIYQRGVAWMLRGTIHLILYRAVYQFVIIAATDIASATDLARYVVANFLLYLRISGQFHLIVGMLHLFGFRLPETHHFFYLASSFTDFWRRINIYWKDFMQKVFYYPAYFRLRKRGDTFALVTSTLFVFFVTWCFHSYQWFWIVGRVLLSWTDVLFWATLAVLLVANSIWEVRRGRLRGLNNEHISARNVLKRSAAIAATFLIIAVLWSLWSSSSVREWMDLWAAANLTWSSTLVLLAVFAASAAAAAGWLATRSLRNLSHYLAGPPFARSAIVSATSILLLIMVARAGTAERFSAGSRVVVDALRDPQLNDRDARLLQRGYYEDLTTINRLNSQLWQVYSQKPQSQQGAGNDPHRPTGDFLRREMLPSATIMHKGFSIRLNRWGLRDRDYERIPAPGIHRIALLGSSYAFGSGVADGEAFESVLEARLNAEPPRGTSARSFELLNFAKGGYTPAEQLVLLERKVISFRPRTIFLISHKSDLPWSALSVWRALRDSVPIPFAPLREIAAAAGIRGSETQATAERRLRPHEPDILSWIYGRIVELCARHGATPIWVFVPMPGDDSSAAEAKTMKRLAINAGFEIVDLSDVYAESDVESLKVAPWDWHPNANGHRIIASALFDSLHARPELISSIPRREFSQIVPSR
jgi:D-alanyl-lipoteichoic acid acyltransferase DltB (MBOAT superfamily)